MEKLRIFLKDCQRLPQLINGGEFSDKDAVPVTQLEEALLCWCNLPLNAVQHSATNATNYDYAVDSHNVTKAEAVLHRDFQVCQPQRSGEQDEMRQAQFAKFIHDYMEETDSLVTALVTNKDNNDPSVESMVISILNSAHSQRLAYDLKRARVEADAVLSAKSYAAVHRFEQYLVAAILSPVAVVAEAIGYNLNIKQNLHASYEGYTIVAPMVVRHKMCCTAVVVTRSPYLSIGYGAKRHYNLHRKDREYMQHFDGTMGADSEQRAIDNFHEAFSDGVRQCMALQCRKMVLCDGVHYIIFELGESQPGPGVAVELVFIVHHSETLDTFMTPKEMLLTFLAREPERTGLEQFANGLYKLMRKPQHQLNQERKGDSYDARIREWCLAAAPYRDAFLGSTSGNRTITTANCTTTELLSTPAMGQPNQVLRCKVNGDEHPVILKVFDPYYYITDQPEALNTVTVPTPVINALQEWNFYDLLRPLQGGVIPKCYYSGWCDVTVGVAGGQHLVIRGPMLCLEDVGNEHAKCETVGQVAAVQQAVAQLHAHDVVHGNLSLQHTVFVDRGGNVRIIALGSARFVRGARYNKEETSGDNQVLAGLANIDITT